MRSVSIGILIEKRHPDRYRDGVSPVVVQTVDRLRGRGATVEVLVLDDLVIDITALRPQHDLYLLKSKSEITYSIAAALEVAGAAVINTARSSMLTWDKIAGTAVLASGGLPVPVSWATGDTGTLQPLFREGSLWLKPQYGKQGSEVCRLYHAQDLARVGAWVDSLDMPLPTFVQRHVPSTGQDLKVYVVGQQVWGLLKPWPIRSAEDKRGVPVSISGPIREAALACGNALGLELYGVDVLLDGDRFVVADVNPFPGYNGLDAAPDAIADYVYGKIACHRMAAWEAA